MDNILNNTLTGTTPTMPKGLQAPDLTGNAQADIKTLQGAQKQPSMLMDFQKVMQNTARQAYNERQTTEMGIAGQQFDPTKVSGGTFASIIGNLEQKRGADISKVYKSTMDTYQEVQNQITQRLQFLQAQERQREEFETQMKMREKEHEQEMKFREKELERLEKNDKRAYKMEKEKFEMDKKSWELSYQKALSGGSGKASDEASDIVDTMNYLESSMGNDFKVSPEAYNLAKKNWISFKNSPSEFDNLFQGFINFNDPNWSKNYDINKKLGVENSSNTVKFEDE
jgi:hypothetical protein